MTNPLNVYIQWLCTLNTTYIEHDSEANTGFSERGTWLVHGIDILYTDIS